MKDPTKEAFLRAWPGGYRENWEVYGSASGIPLDVVLNKCLRPYYNKNHIALEIGCGLGFWTFDHLAKNFKEVIALDLLKDIPMKPFNVRYQEVPDRNYSCHQVPDNSIDFAWSFGVFCHLPISAIQTYLNSIFRVLKPGGKVALYFSNSDRRPGRSTPDNNSENDIVWVDNNWDKTKQMMEQSGFVEIVDLIPELFDTIAGAQKPYAE